MVRFLFVILSFTACLSSNAFNNKVDIIYNIPKNVQAGSEFVITVSINKANLSGLARLQIEMPNGFEAIEKKSANGEFRFVNQTVILQWLKLPIDEIIDISVTVKVNPTIQGYVVIKGAFTYIVGGKRTDLEIYPHILTISPSEGTDEIIVGNNNEIEVDVSAFVKNGISCIRKKPSLDENNEIVVKMLVTKGGLSKFGKIQEQIPVGYKAVSLKTKNSIFVYNSRSRTVKFMWMNLPTEQQYIVSYKLMPQSGVADGAFIITGKFFYAENNSSKEIEVVERNIDF